MGVCVGLGVVRSMATPSALAVSATTAGSTRPTRPPRGSRVLKDSCSRNIFCGRRGSPSPLAVLAPAPPEGAVLHAVSTCSATPREFDRKGCATPQHFIVLRSCLRFLRPRPAAALLPLRRLRRPRPLRRRGFAARQLPRRGSYECTSASWANGLRPILFWGYNIKVAVRVEGNSFSFAAIARNEWTNGKIRPHGCGGDERR